MTTARKIASPPERAWSPWYATVTNALGIYEGAVDVSTLVAVDRVIADRARRRGRRHVVAFVANATRARSLLVALGLPAAPATFAPARDPPQTELAWVDPA